MTAQHFYVVHMVVSAGLQGRAPVHYAIGFGIDRGRGHWRRRGQKLFIVALIGQWVQTLVQSIGMSGILPPASERATQRYDLLNSMWLRAGNLSGINAAQGMSYQCNFAFTRLDKRLHRFTQSLFIETLCSHVAALAPAHGGVAKVLKKLY